MKKNLAPGNPRKVTSIIPAFIPDDLRIVRAIVDMFAGEETVSFDEGEFHWPTPPHYVEDLAIYYLSSNPDWMRLLDALGMPDNPKSRLKVSKAIQRVIESDIHLDCGSTVNLVEDCYFQATNDVPSHLEIAIRTTLTIALTT